MADLSRRNFLTKASLGVAAGVAATSGLVTPGLLATAAAADQATAVDLSPIGEDVVAVVRNASTGEVAVMSGMREVVVHDRQLAGRLLRAARSTAKE